MGHDEYLVTGWAYIILMVQVLTVISYSGRNRFVVAAIISEMSDWARDICKVDNPDEIINFAFTLCGVLFAAFIGSCGVNHILQHEYGQIHATVVSGLIETVLTTTTVGVFAVFSWRFRAAALIVRAKLKKKGARLRFWHELR